MVDHTQTHQNTNAGTSSKSRSKSVQSDSIQNDLKVAGLGHTSEDDVIKDLGAFSSAINAAKIRQQESIDVSEEIFAYWARGSATPFIMYEGIRVYKAGTREKLELREGKTPEQLTEMDLAEKKAAKE